MPAKFVRDALRLHETYHYRIVEDLRAAIEKGWDGPASKRSVKGIIAFKSQRKKR